MCIIIFAPAGEIPHARLTQSLARNPDGWGYMFSDGKAIKVRRGLDGPAFLKQWAKDAAARKNNPVVFHARIGTSGSQSMLNCHPFRIPGHGLWLAHNGIIHRYHGIECEANDTQLFISDVLTGLPRGWLNNEATLRLIEQAIGRSNKLAIMSTAGQVVILNEEAGYWDHGIWYSNGSCMPPPPPLKVGPVVISRRN